MKSNQKRSQQKRSLILAIALALPLFSTVPLQAAIGQRTASGSPATIFEETTLLSLTWSDIWGRLRRKEVPGGSRGNSAQEVCAVLPGTLSDQDSDEISSLHVWDLNPAFVWQGEWSQLEVRHSRSHQLLLTQTLTPEDRQLVYSDVADATPLEPGGSYYWTISRQVPGDEFLIFGETSFRTLNARKRQALETELAAMLDATDTPEQALSKRVSFFAEQGLWADVFRELHTDEVLPAELERLKEEISNHDFCQQPQEISLGIE